MPSAPEVFPISIWGVFYSHELQDNISYDLIGQAVWDVEGGAIDFPLLILYFHSVCSWCKRIPKSQKVDAKKFSFADALKKSSVKKTHSCENLLFCLDPRRGLALRVSSCWFSKKRYIFIVIEKKGLSYLTIRKQFFLLLNCISNCPHFLRSHIIWFRLKMLTTGTTKSVFIFSIGF